MEQTAPDRDSRRSCKDCRLSGVHPLQRGVGKPAREFVR
jgi:hypothetical protein